ncbi:hypothetical protein HDU99_008836, partial [Rhizoclosmatium hyalinum]
STLAEYSKDPSLSSVSGSSAHSNDPYPLTDSPNAIFTAIQISDIHISRSNSHGGIQHFAFFLQQELPTIAPSLLLLTGDLVDAKSPSKLLSLQFHDEW